MSRSPNTHLCVTPVTPQDAEAFYNLIQEQAAQHASASAHHDQRDIDHLFEQAIANQGINAFLVRNRETQERLAAVTYIPCVSTDGLGHYLEDIITTQSARRQGIGHFAMAVLAQLTLQQGFHFVACECAHNNSVAQDFYTGLGASRVDNRHTWRILGELLKPTISANYAVRPMTREDIPALIALLPQDPADPLFTCARAKILAVLARTDDARRLLVATQCTTGQVVAAALAYRNFSTFRAVSGLHAEWLVCAPGHEQAATPLLCTYGQLQRVRGWNGHFDFTLSESQLGGLQPQLHALGFAPLAYGGDRMVVRKIQDTADASPLTALANSIPVWHGAHDRLPLIAPTTPTSVRPRPQNFAQLIFDGAAQ